MEREILFRGKRIDNGEWVCGYFVENESDEYRAYIVTAARWETDDDGDTDLIETTVYQVDPATVGQYTSIADKNRKKIFEGDICRCKMMNDEHENYDVGFYCVKWNECNAIFELSGELEDLEFCFLSECEVIGNIHDNPELLEAERQRTSRTANENPKRLGF